MDTTAVRLVRTDHPGEAPPVVALHGLASSRAWWRLVAERSGQPSTTPLELMRLDLRLHRAVYAATGNPYLESTLISYDNLATRIWCLFLDRLPGLAACRPT